MLYTIKPGDTLSKIASSRRVPVSSLIKLNPQLTNPDLLVVGQVIHVPNTEDIPAGATFDTPVKVAELVLKARSMVNCRIRYKLGSGGMHAEDDSPSRDNLCDCSGFVCWVLGLSRQTKIPFYKHFGGWIFTDSMEADIRSASGIFEQLSRPEPGCLVLYGAGSKIGHVGIVSEVAGTAMRKVIHCSSGNDRTFHAAIQETASTVFNRADSVWGKFVG